MQQDAPSVRDALHAVLHEQEKHAGAHVQQKPARPIGPTGLAEMMTAVLRFAVSARIQALGRDPHSEDNRCAVDKARAVLVGSQSLGVQTKDSDADMVLVVVLPCVNSSSSSSSFHSRKRQRREQVAPEQNDSKHSDRLTWNVLDVMSDMADQLRNQPDWIDKDSVVFLADAQPPILKCCLFRDKTGWHEVDLQMVLAPHDAPLYDFLDDRWLIGTQSATPPIQALRLAQFFGSSLLPRGDAVDQSASEVFFETEEKRVAFTRLLQWVRMWARQRQLTGNRHGMLGGVSWAILAAHVIQSYFERDGMTPFNMLRAFFFEIGRWNWPIPLFITAPRFRPAVMYAQAFESKQRGELVRPVQASLFSGDESHRFLSAVAAAQKRAFTSVQLHSNQTQKQKRRLDSAQEAECDLQIWCPQTFLHSAAALHTKQRRAPVPRCNTFLSLGMVTTSNCDIKQTPSEDQQEKPTPLVSWEWPSVPAGKEEVKRVPRRVHMLSAAIPAVYVEIDADSADKNAACPKLLLTAQESKSWHELRRNGMPVIIPVLPNTNTAFNVSSTNARIVQQECQRAYRLLRDAVSVPDALTLVAAPYVANTNSCLRLFASLNKTRHPTKQVDDWVQRLGSQAWRLPVWLHEHYAPNVLRVRPIPNPSLLATPASLPTSYSLALEYEMHVDALDTSAPLWKDFESVALSKVHKWMENFREQWTTCSVALYLHEKFIGTAVVQ